MKMREKTEKIKKFNEKIKPYHIFPAIDNDKLVFFVQNLETRYCMKEENNKLFDNDFDRYLGMILELCKLAEEDRKK